MKLGILDVGTIQEGSNSISTIHETIKIAQKAEEFGFYRYWLAEHHEIESAWRSPLIVLALLAGYTNRIKVGAAGILLPVSNPLRIAQDFKLLENLFPRRIDLGIAKAGTADSVSKELLENSNLAENILNHPARIKKVMDFLNEKKDIITPPINGRSPDVWLLSTSNKNISLAIEHKCSLSISLFHKTNMPPSPEIISEFKERFFDTHGTIPSINIAISGCCFPNDAEVNRFLNINNGIEANFVGTKSKIANDILNIKEKYGVEEIIWLDLSYNIKNKIYSLGAISESMGIS